MSPKPKFDALGRRCRTRPTPTGKRVSLQPRDLLWFEKLAEHGPLPTSFLIGFTQDTHQSEKRAKERLTDLFNEDATKHNGPYLTRPPQQFRTIDSRYNQLVHDLAPAALGALKQAGSPIRQSRSGPWLHSLMVGCITASIELACLACKGVRFIPQSSILARANAELRWPTEIADPNTGAVFTKDLLPDAVFGLEYLTDLGARYRFFAVEADRATEPTTTGNFHRKSFERHLLQYTEYIEGGGYQEHLSLTAPMMVLNVTTSEQRAERMLALTQELFPKGNNYQLIATWEAFGTPFAPPHPKHALFLGEWSRSRFPPVRLCDP